MANPSKADRAIGIFDSGFGGLTVFKALAGAMPYENLIYLGDAARLPYGSKSDDTIIRYTDECARWLVTHNIKMLVIACHTASSIAIEALRQRLTIPVASMVEPCLPMLQKYASSGKVAILGTQATISSAIYQKELKKIGLDHALASIACPLFAPLVEEGLIKTSIAQECIRHYLSPLKKIRPSAVLLACTHYPLIKEEIQNFLGDQCHILDPATLCAEAVKALLSDQDLLNLANQVPYYQFFTTDDKVRFKMLGEKFLDRQINTVEKVTI